MFYGGLAGGVLLTGSPATERLAAAGLPLRLDHHDLAQRRVGHDRAGRRRDRGLRRRWRRSCSRCPRTRSSPGSAGLRVPAYNLLVAVLAAVTVTVAMRTVGPAAGLGPDGRAGGDLAAAHPVASAPRWSRRWCSASLRRSAACCSRRTRRSPPTWPPGPTIVLLSLAGFVATWPLGVWLRSRQRLRAPVRRRSSPTATAPRPTRPRRTSTAPDCGHLAVEHGDHVDYVHDGHRHAVHAPERAHYDEH